MNELSPSDLALPPDQPSKSIFFPLSLLQSAYRMVIRRLPPAACSGGRERCDIAKQPLRRLTDVRIRPIVCPHTNRTNAPAIGRPMYAGASSWRQAVQLLILSSVHCGIGDPTLPRVLTLLSKQNKRSKLAVFEATTIFF